MQLIDSSERADTLLSKRTGVGFEPVTSWLRTRGTNRYAIAARRLFINFRSLYIHTLVFNIHLNYIKKIIQNRWMKI